MTSRTTFAVSAAVIFWSCGGDTGESPKGAGGIYGVGGSAGLGGRSDDTGALDAGSEPDAYNDQNEIIFDAPFQLPDVWRPPAENVVDGGGTCAPPDHVQTFTACCDDVPCHGYCVL